VRHDLSRLYPPEKERHTGCLIFFLCLIALCVGVYAGIWAMARHDVAQYLPEALRAPLYSPTPTSASAANPTVVPVVLSDAETPAPVAETQAPETPAPPAETPVPTETPTAAPPPAYETFKKGDRNDQIIPVQQALIDGGFLQDVADGIFGGKTEEALLAYQAAVGIEQTGLADAATQQKMFYVEPPPEPSQEETQAEEVPAQMENISLSLGERRDIAGFAAVQFDRYEFSYEVLPSREDEDTIPVFFETETADTMFLFIDGVIENLSGASIASRDVRFSIYTNVQEYAGFTALEIDDGTNLNQFAELNAGEQTRIVLLVEVPAELASSQEAIVAYATMGNTIYQITLR
jgi:peptidoglycan hydrolase-like protein with peptidoglycan-binding domain